MWRYRTTWVRESEDGDREAIDKHLSELAEAGWELVNANAVQFLMVQSQQVATYAGAVAMTYSTAVMRHYFYWKKRVDG
jgi:hypothetical protein